MQALVEEYGLSGEASAKNGWTPLHWAAAAGHGQVVEYLIGIGCGVDVRNKFGCTPLHYAASRGHVRVVEALVVGHGANVEARSRDGKLPVDFAQNIHVKRLLQMHSKAMQELVVRILKLEDASRSVLYELLAELEAEEERRYWEAHPERIARTSPGEASERVLLFPPPAAHGNNSGSLSDESDDEGESRTSSWAAGADLAALPMQMMHGVGELVRHEAAPSLTVAGLAGAAAAALGFVVYRAVWRR